jgi:tetratricopeptide (TPR) repeat protein
MSEDKQDNKHTDDSSVTSDDAVMEQVTEERLAKKQGGRLGGLLLVVILIGAGVAAWYYQAMWLPQAQQWWATLMPAQEEADPMAAPEPRGAETEQVSTGSESSGYVLSAITEEKPAEETTQDVVAEASSTADPVSEETSSEQEVESPALEVAPTDDAVKNVASNAASAETEMAAVPAPVIPMVPRIQDTTSTTSAATTTTTTSIEQARQAFWARDLVKAEAMYRELLKREPAAADAWGELGNVYYGQAKWQQAATAYAEAAIQLLEQGQYSQAMFLHYVVQGLDPAQAARIEAKTRSMQAAPRG